MIFKKRKKAKREPLYSPQTYDAEAQKTESMPVEHDDAAWTTVDYAIPQSFMKFYYVDFTAKAEAMLPAVDEGIPWFMDQVISDAAGEAIAQLKREYVGHKKSANDLMIRKGITIRSLTRELEEVNAEKIRIEELIKKIGGKDYEGNL